VSESPITPFPTPPGLTAVGAEEDAGICVDGVCAVPEAARAHDDDTAPRPSS